LPPARLLSKLESEEAEQAWRALIEHNPDCLDYYRAYLSHRGTAIGLFRNTLRIILTNLVADTTSVNALSILREISAQLPRASAPRRLALTVAGGDEFRELVTPYLLSGLTKGVPSLFSDIKALYRDHEKRQIVEEIVETARAEFTSNHSASADPTTYLWTLYFLAQHHSYLLRLTQALKIIDEALAHTPTLPELLTCKARILKRAGDFLGGARCANEARLLDGQDRFLNTKCAKYLLRAALVEEASTILGLFTKVRLEDVFDYDLSLHNMHVERCSKPWCGSGRHAVPAVPHRRG
jgi:N-alpha-acetyltransferase 15/16, NatA auxiliary subunit